MQIDVGPFTIESIIAKTPPSAFDISFEQTESMLNLFIEKKSMENIENYAFEIIPDGTRQDNRNVNFGLLEFVHVEVETVDGIPLDVVTDNGSWLIQSDTTEYVLIQIRNDKSQFIQNAKIILLGWGEVPELFSSDENGGAYAFTSEEGEAVLDFLTLFDICELQSMPM